ncbi:extracellular solute-binding protein [Neomegalonema sp.]|uniref:extracellular solute-binding protein n=1 Tax=Neomegalonema sp. TaxID=2039713 RepID=UPI00260816FD|nr:extracellular solute-binding protein [Neomegalonema sp.]MDD2867265.1 extracellular solute-binding protein [Neomegalonema sp.]
MIDSSGAARPAPPPAQAMAPGPADARRIGVIQRLLARLGYLAPGYAPRSLDAPTQAAFARFRQDRGTLDAEIHSEGFLRQLISAVSRGGKIDGLDLVVDQAQIHETQSNLRKLGYAPGPIDGIFGFATMSAIEIFQEDFRMQELGLLTTNMYDAIRRAAENQDVPFKGEVRVLNWTDYIDPEILRSFERETEIRVVYEVFSSAEDADRIMGPDYDAYDLVLNPSYKIPGWISSGRLAPIDAGRLTNYAGIDPGFWAYSTDWDPGRAKDTPYAIPYMWGVVGLVMDSGKVGRLLGPTSESWGLLLDPGKVSRLASCGVIIADEPNEMLMAMAGYVTSPKSRLSPQVVAELGQFLSQSAQHIEVVDAERFIERVKSENFCLAVGYSGDAMTAMRAHAADRSKTASIRYFIPEKEGSSVWIDYFTLSARSANQDAALRFLDYLLKAEVAGLNTNHVNYANPVAASGPFIDKALLENPAIYPSTQVWGTLSMANQVDAALQDQIDRIWSQLKR